MLTDLRLPRASNRARRAATCTASKHSVDVAVRWNAGQSLAAAARLRESRAHSGSALGSAWRAAGEPQAAQLTTPSICACHAAMPNAALDDLPAGYMLGAWRRRRGILFPLRKVWGALLKVWGLADSLTGRRVGPPSLHDPCPGGRKAAHRAPKSVWTSSFATMQPTK